MRNKFSIVVNTVSILVFFLYWSLKFSGGMRDLEGVLDTIKTIYLHLVITLFVIIDLFSANHDRHRFSLRFLAFETIYFLLYLADAGVATFVYNDPPYPFMETLNYTGLATYTVSFYLVLVFCYYFLVKLYDI